VDDPATNDRFVGAQVRFEETCELSADRPGDVGAARGTGLADDIVRPLGKAGRTNF